MAQVRKVVRGSRPVSPNPGGQRGRCCPDRNKCCQSPRGCSGHRSRSVGWGGLGGVLGYGRYGDQQGGQQGQRIVMNVVYKTEHQCLSVSLPFPSRVGQRGSGGLSMSAARSEHEVSEIIDGLSEQEVRPGYPFSSSSPLTPLFSKEARRVPPGPMVKSDTNSH